MLQSRFPEGVSTAQYAHNPSWSDEANQGSSISVRDETTHLQLTDGRGRDGSLAIGRSNITGLDMNPDKVDGGKEREGYGSDYEQDGGREEEKEAGDAECSGHYVGV